MIPQSLHVGLIYSAVVAVGPDEYLEVVGTWEEDWSDDEGYWFTLSGSERLLRWPEVVEFTILGGKRRPHLDLGPFPFVLLVSVGCALAMAS